MDENVKNNQLNDEYLEGVCGGVSEDVDRLRNIVENFLNTKSNQASVQTINLCGDNVQPASERRRETKISHIMTETEMKQAGKKL